MLKSSSIFVMLRMASTGCTGFTWCTCPYIRAKLCNSALRPTAELTSGENYPNPCQCCYLLSFRFSVLRPQALIEACFISDVPLLKVASVSKDIKLWVDGPNERQKRLMSEWTKKNKTPVAYWSEGRQAVSSFPIRSLSTNKKACKNSFFPFLTEGIKRKASQHCEKR